jgi:4'-phosphopantetheinyl transferase
MNKCLIYYTNIEKVCWEQIKTHINSLSIRDKDKILSLKTDHDKCASLIGRLLLFHIVQINNPSTQYNLRDVLFSINGRPYFRNSKFDFNISHSGAIVSCGYFSEGFIGIDVEKITPININEYHSVLSTKEIKCLNKKDNNIEYFYKVWTIKESVLKANGVGLLYDLKSIIIKSKSSIINNKVWFNYVFHLEENYYLAVSTNNKTYPSLQYINLESII